MPLLRNKIRSEGRGAQGALIPVKGEVSGVKNTTPEAGTPAPAPRSTKALIVAPAWIGDTVMAQPLFMRLHQRFPELQLDALAPAFAGPGDPPHQNYRTGRARKQRCGSGQLVPARHGGRGNLVAADVRQRRDRSRGRR